MSNNKPMRKPALPGGKVAYFEAAMTLEEVGREMQLTKERVRQIEAKALMKAARYLHERRIGAGDLLDDEPGDAASVLATMGAMSRNMRR